MAAQALTEYLEASAARLPDKTAVVDPAGWSITYADLNRRADALAGYLAASGVEPGDRVGLVLPKGVASVTTLFGIMKAGAAYVPIDHTAPAERGRRILTDCDVRALVVHGASLDVVPDDRERPVIVVEPSGELPSAAMTPFETAIERGAPRPSFRPGLSDLAYILYTSGSTGIPKGVMLTHENAVSFVEWCSETFAPTAQDRFSSHAPFHFDLSVLDIYLSLKHGATLFIISETLGKDPRELADFIVRHRLTVWYSTPSILTLLTQFGHLEEHDCSSLRLVFFAGEVFPAKHLREVKKHWPGPVYYNLYGPTETNVCTFARIPDVVPDDRDTPYPIGFLCSHCQGLVLDGDGREAAAGEEGLLYISGPSVFQGYWNRPTENAAAFLDRDGVRWYNTGDVVRWHDEDGYIYLGRRDRMVKRRGYRIELGEIERALYLHPRVREAAVISTADAEAGVRITAFLSCGEGPAPSIIELKTFCAAHLPPYMSPDRFVVKDRLPRTSTDKIDYQTLRQAAAAPAQQTT
jgi:amino acid adenylation domain-containing protein